MAQPGAVTGWEEGCSWALNLGRQLQGLSEPTFPRACPSMCVFPWSLPLTLGSRIHTQRVLQ